MPGTEAPAKRWGSGLLVALVVICLIIAAILLAVAARGRGRGSPGATGGRAPRPRSDHLVVDTLNLAHWLRGRAGRDARSKLGLDEIVGAIDHSAPPLRRRYPGRVMFVLKDRETELTGGEARAALHAAARRNRVYVSLAEQYVDPPRGVPKSSAHSARGRDDFYMALLAWKWRCPVATEDRLRDFPQLRATIQPFHVNEWAYWRDQPLRDFIRPEAPTHVRVKKPRAVRFEELGL